MRNLEVLHINLRLHNDLKGLGGVQMAAQGAKRPLGSAGAPPASQRTSGPLMGSAGQVKPGVRYRCAAQG
jgi:hypothetical protein